jgi:hypothetical protein
VKYPSRVLLELNSLGSSTLHGSFDRVYRSVEVALGYLQSGFLGLTNVLQDALVLFFQLGVVTSLVANDRGVLLVLPGVWSYISQDTHLGYVGVVFWVDSFQFRMQSIVSCAGQAGIAFVYLGVGISLLEEDAGAFTYLRYVCYPEPAMKRAALYMRVSTLDQHHETQLYDLR